MATARDPVCGMTVDTERAAARHEHAGSTYWFCAVHCRDRFAREPERYLEPPPPMPAPAPETDPGPDRGALYTCPMHPQVLSREPGACPICGMALESLSGADQDEGELRDMRRRLVASAVLTLPVFVLAMGRHVVGDALGAWLSPAGERWVQLALTTPVVFWCGWPLVARGWTSLVTLRLNMFTLIGLGVAAAYGFSAVATLAPGLFPAGFRGHDGAVGVYFESAAVIVTLVLLGQVLELRARASAGDAIRALLDLAPPTARRVRADGVEEDVPLAEVRAGERLRVRPGERVPVDALVEEGASALDESLLSGESLPVEKGPGDAVTGGTLNTSGSLLVRAARVGADTLLARIVALVAEARRTRAPIQRTADAVAAWFVPAVVAAATVTFAAWSLAGPEPRLAHALLSAVAVLIIACPCALGLATPMSILVATGRAARVGVLFRDAEAIERLRAVDVLLVDKTGTLTAGNPALTRVVARGPTGEARLLSLAAALEAHSEHPLAAAIVRGAREPGSAPAAATGFRSIPGKGVSGSVSGRALVLGSQAYMAELGVADEALARQADELRGDGATVLFAAIDGAAAGLFAVSDPIKDSTPAALAALREEGLRIVMLTGDARRTAEAVARALAIDEVIAEARPEAKLDAIARLQAEGRVVAMAGDGTNDAPALARADVGIAMGTGTDVALESAGVTLVRGDLAGIVRARRLSRATLANIRQNLFLAFAYNAAAIPLAAGALYPFFGLLLSPMVAAAAMSLSSVSVIGNALRLRRVPL
jgi:Cu+-exporting ATPase